MVVLFADAAALLQAAVRASGIGHLRRHSQRAGVTGLLAVLLPLMAGTRLGLVGAMIAATTEAPGLAAAAVWLMRGLVRCWYCLSYS